VQVDSRGGLGNQLFGLYAALWCGQKLMRKTVLDITDIDRNHTSGKYDLKSFKLSSSILVRKQRPIEAKARRLSNLILGGSCESIFQDSSINSRELLLQKLEFEMGRGKLPSRIILKGFFQDFSFFDSVEPNVKKLELYKPSTDYLLFAEEIKKKRPIVVHIRLGDYLNHKIGMLSEKYFISSIEAIKKTLGNREIWIFTNSPEQLEYIYPSISKQNFRVLTPSGDPAESMILMSKAEGIVCSNSTFSFWAAKLSKIECKVVVPKNYSKDSETQIRNIPAHWIQIENTWM
jgi:hypothetical protein